MENEMQEIKTTGRKGIKNFFKSSIEKIRNFDKEMSDWTSFSFPDFPIDLGMKITYSISKIVFKIFIVLSMIELAFFSAKNFSDDYKEVLNLSLNGIGNSVQENKYLEFLKKLGKTSNNLKIDYNIQDFSKLGFLSQMEEMRKIKFLSSDKKMLESRCSSKKNVAISETVRCKLK